MMEPLAHMWPFSIVLPSQTGPGMSIPVPPLSSRWDRSDWGEGGNYFYWWCTEAAEAYCADQALYRRYIHELTAIMGKQTYRKLVETLERLT